MKQNEIAVSTIVGLMTAFIVLKVVAATTGFDVFAKALEAMRPSESELAKAREAR